MKVDNLGARVGCGRLISMRVSPLSLRDVALHHERVEIAVSILDLLARLGAIGWNPRRRVAEGKGPDEGVRLRACAVGHLDGVISDGPRAGAGHKYPAGSEPGRGEHRREDGVSALGVYDDDIDGIVGRPGSRDPINANELRPDLNGDSRSRIAHGNATGIDHLSEIRKGHARRAEHLGPDVESAYRRQKKRNARSPGVDGAKPRRTLITGVFLDVVEALRAIGKVSVQRGPRGFRQRGLIALPVAILLFLKMTVPGIVGNLGNELLIEACACGIGADEFVEPIPIAGMDHPEAIRNGVLSDEVLGAIHLTTQCLRPEG